MRFSFDCMSVTNASLVDDAYEINSGLDKIKGFSIAYEHAFKVARDMPLFVQTGAGINALFQKGEDEHDYGSSGDYWAEEKLRMMSLTIPVNVVYGIRINDALTVKPYTGLYLRFNLYGKSKWKGEEVYGTHHTEFDDTLNPFDKEEVEMDDDVDAIVKVFKRVQVGWQIGATLDFRKFNVGIGYALDFNPITKLQDDYYDRYYDPYVGDYVSESLSSDFKLRKFFVRVGYNF